MTTQNTQCKTGPATSVFDFLKTNPSINKILKMRILSIITVTLLPLLVNPESIAEESERQVIADFENDTFVAGKKTSHKASVTLVNDVPEGGSKLAVKTVVDPDAGTKQFFGTGFKIPVTDFSRSGEIRNKSV